MHVFDRLWNGEKGIDYGSYDRRYTRYHLFRYSFFFYKCVILNKYQFHQFSQPSNEENQLWLHKYVHYIMEFEIQVFQGKKTSWNLKDVATCKFLGWVWSSSTEEAHSGTHRRVKKKPYAQCIRFIIHILVTCSFGPYLKCDLFSFSFAFSIYFFSLLSLQSYLSKYNDIFGLFLSNI